MNLVNKKIIIGSGIIVLLLITGYFFLRPDFKVHSNQTPESIRGGFSGVNETSYYSPNPEKLKILVITVRSHHRGELKSKDFTVNFKTIETEEWKIDKCQGFCPVDDPDSRGMLWFFADNEEYITLNGKLGKFMHLAFLVPVSIKEVTLLYKGKSIGKVYISQ